MIQVKKFLKLYQDPKLLIIFLLGIVSGLPLAMVGSNFSIWLTEAGISRSTIGFMSLVFMPYSLRFIWSPLLDTVKLPNFLGFNVDNRCRWMIALIIATAGFIFMASQLDLKADIAVAAILMIAITSCSATLDSAIDGYRISITPDDQQAAAAAMATTGYRGGMLISGGGGLAMAEYYGWALTYKAVASLMLASILVVLIASKCCKVMADKIEESKQSSFSELLRIKLIEPIKALIKVDSVWLILIFIAIFRLGDSFLHTMNSPLLIELG
ncbi:MAG: MFS transporter, partial [Pseudomonadota bacterium]